jgi:PhoH-like ATPase
MPYLIEDLKDQPDHSFSFEYLQQLLNQEETDPLTASDISQLLELEGEPVNSYHSIRSEAANGKTSVLVKITQNGLTLIQEPRNFLKIKPANLEQSFAFHALADNQTKILTLVGQAGSGKTLITLAYALDALMTSKTFKRIVLTKPRTQVLDDDDTEMGEVPGDILAKMAPQLISYNMAFQRILTDKGTQYLELAIKKEDIMIIPLEHMRGVDFKDTLVICDEAQNLGRSQLKTLTTRIGHGSKLILMGDLDQDDKLYKRDRNSNPILFMANHPLYRQSKYTAFIKLEDVMRHEVVELMTRIFK